MPIFPPRNILKAVYSANSEAKFMNSGCDNKMTCPITHTLDLISAKWTVEILRELALKPVRTREFLTFIPGLSMKSLQERLKALLAAGMITRTVFEQKLPKVVHTITPRGQRLFLVMSELKAIASEISESEQLCQCPLEGFGKDEMNCPKRRPLTPRQLRQE